MTEGWIALYRKITDHWLWQENREKTRAEAWIDILMQAQHSTKPTKNLIRGRLVMCGYGESIKSLDTWGDRWKWKKGKVRNFFKLLEKEGQIETVNETVTLRLIVCNYKQYDAKMQTSQTVPNTQGTRKEHSGDIQTTPDKNDKKVNNEKNENKESVKSVDLPALFDAFVTKFYNEYIMVHYKDAGIKIENEQKAMKTLVNVASKNVDEYYEVLTFLQSDTDQGVFWRGCTECIAGMTKIHKDTRIRKFNRLLGLARSANNKAPSKKDFTTRQSSKILSSKVHS